MCRCREASPGNDAQTLKIAWNCARFDPLVFVEPDATCFAMTVRESAQHPKQATKVEEGLQQFNTGKTVRAMAGLEDTLVRYFSITLVCMPSSS